MNANIDFVVQNLLEQIALLSKEKAIFYALATEKEQENEKLRKEIAQLKEEQ